MTSPIIMPTMSEAQADAWHALMKVYEVILTRANGLG